MENMAMRKLTKYLVKQLITLLPKYTPTPHSLTYIVMSTSIVPIYGNPNSGVHLIINLKKSKILPATGPNPMHNIAKMK